MVRDPKFGPDTKAPLLVDPRRPGGSRRGSLDSAEARSLLWVGRILHVDTETMVCSIQLETGGIGERHDVPLPGPAGAGPRSWSGNIPERGTKVVLGWRRYDERAYVPYIIGFMTVGAFPGREYEPFSTVDPEDAAEAIRVAPELADDPHVNLDVIRLKLRKAYPGDFLASASDGADFLLDRNAALQNRAGNEYILRDSDQTAVLQVVNEFTSNAAGYYRRGLIKRTAFNFLPDLALSGFDPSRDDYDAFVAGKFTVSEDSDGNPLRTLLTKVGTDSAAFSKLREFGLVNPDGTPVEPVPTDPADPFYPFVVLSDGQRASYSVLGEHENSFADTDQCYVEDRTEIRHTSDGTMAVTEEGDGVQIDPIPPILIEDVKGTVVGNDPYTEAGRSLYGRILTMRVFDDPDQAAPSPGPIIEPVDTLTSQTEADTKALCRLFHVRSPNGVNQYAFGVTKEGKILLHVPMTTTGGVQEKGKSIDANIVGLIKAIVGMDPNSKVSMDLRTQGGIKLDIGSFTDLSDPQNPEQVSVELHLAGKIRTIYSGEQGRETLVGGSDFSSVTGSKMDMIGGNKVENVGGSKAVEAFSITDNAGFGGKKSKCAGDYNNTVLGKTMELYAQLRQTTFALSDLKTMLAGVDSTTVLAGAMARTVVAGAGIADTVTAGNMASTVGAGNMLMSVGTGNLAATVGAGNLALTAGAGAATMTAGVTASLVAGTVANVTAPIVKLGVAVVGSAVAGVPGPPGPHLDYVTGLPIKGVPTVTLG